MKSRIRKIVKNRYFGVVLITLLTILYFLPILVKVNSYIPGGDAMFNAWTIARNQNCILRDRCDDYSNANIYFPNQDTMLYSEAELSAGAVMLPLRLVTDNPITHYNILTVLSFLAVGVSMYLLAMYLSGGNKFVAITAGLAFEFSPIMIASTHHLQNLSIFCLPLAILSILKYLEVKKKRYLLFLLLSLLYVFYASWYQMIFVLLALGLFGVGLLITKKYSIKELSIVALVIGAATLSTFPLGLQYVQFSKTNNATYTLQEKVDNSASLGDYVISPDHTALGKATRKFTRLNNFNPDTYSYVGITLAAMSLCGIYLLAKKRKRDKERLTLIGVFTVIGGIGFVVSLGPFLKLAGTHLYKVAGGAATLPLPYLFVHTFIPQLGFIRGVGRASVLLIFALCCLFALTAPTVLRAIKSRRLRNGIAVALLVLLAFELVPTTLVPLDNHPHAHHAEVPRVYQFIKSKPEIDNIITLQAQEYPDVKFWFARTENVLWAGYHNRNIYNGYSGYIPPQYEAEYSDFVNLDPDDPAQMRRQGLNYVVVDSLLYKNKPHVLKEVPGILGQPLYKDARYRLYKL